MILSFIIPVYNTAEYLDKCISSIVNQELDSNSFEIIIVNDGSTDNSKQIIDSWQAKAKQIEVITTSNNGLGTARNIAIKASKGKYIFFVDSDDYLFNQSLTGLMDYAKKSSTDIIGFNWALVDADGKFKLQHSNKISYDDAMSGAEYMSKHNLKAGVCFYLYKGDFLRNTPLFMPEGVYHEDEYFLPKAFLFAEKIVFINQTVYAYYQRKDSISNRSDSNFSEKRVADKLYILDKLIALRSSSKLNPLQKQGLKRKIVFFAMDIVVNLIQFKASQEFIQHTTLQLEQRNLYPLLKESYGWKYCLTRQILNNKYIVKIVAKTGLFSKES